jgi:hypothetical protein
VDGKFANVISASGSSSRAISTSSSTKRSTRSRPDQRTTSGGISFTTLSASSASWPRQLCAAWRTAARPLSRSALPSRKQRCFDHGTSTSTLSPWLPAMSRNQRGGVW